MINLPRHAAMVLLFGTVALFNLGCDKVNSHDETATDSSSEQTAALDQQIHTYLINHPEVLIEMSTKLEDKMRQAQGQKAIPVIKAQADALFADKLSPVAGNHQGAVTLIEFFDYQCVACAKSTPMMQKIIATNSTVKVIFKELPIFGPISKYAAKAALAAAKQGKYVAMQQALFNFDASEGKMSTADVDAIASKIGLDLVQLKQDMQAATVAKELSTTRLLAYQLSLEGTPVFIIAPTDVRHSPDKKISFISGSPSIELIQQALDQAT